MEQIEQYLRVLKNSWWIIVASVLIFTGAGLAFSFSQTPIYEQTATFVVNPGVRIADTYDLLYSIDTLAGRVSLATTYANILQSQVIIEQAARSLGVPVSALEDYKISAVVLPESSVLLLQVQGPSPILAADLANAIGTAGLEYITGLQEIYEIRHLDLALASPDIDPISPDHLVNIVLSVVVGFAAGMAFVILRELLTQTVGDTKSASATPVSGPALPNPEDSDLNQDPKSIASEASV